MIKYIVEDLKTNHKVEYDTFEHAEAEYKHRLNSHNIESDELDNTILLYTHIS